MRAAWAVFRKELQETIRDHRTLMMMVVVPVLLYPALMIVSEQLALFGMRQLQAEPARVAIVGGDDALRAFAELDEDIVLLPGEGASPVALVRSDSIAAVAVVADQEGLTQSVTVIYDAADERSERGRGELLRLFRAWGDTILAQRLTVQGLPDGFATPIAVADSSVALPQEVSGSALGRFLPLLLIVITLLGTFYPAIDLAAGEKERGTLETLLTAPVPSHQIVVGKFATVAVVGVLAAALNLTSMYVTFQTGLFQFASEQNLNFSLPFSSLLIVFAVLIPLAVLFGSAFLGIAVRSRSFKEAQNALTPLYMLALVPSLLPLFPGIELTPALAIVPVAGVALFFRELMAGSILALPAFLAMASTVVYAALALLFAARAFGSEDVLFGGGDNDDEPVTGWGDALRRIRGGTRRAVPEVHEALFFIAIVAVLFFYLGRIWQIRWLERGLFLSEWLLLFLPVLLAVRFLMVSGRQTLSLHRPKGKALLAGALLMLGGTPIAWFLTWLQTFVAPIPWDLVEGLTELLTAESGLDLAWLFLLLAFTPAVCEEAVFRGMLLGGTRDRMAPIAAILLNGVIFGAFHMSFETAFRFLPTAFIGTLMAWAVFRTRSIFVSALMHMINNGTIVVIIASPAIAEWLGGPDSTRPPWMLLPPALLLFWLGARLLQSEDVVSSTARGGPSAAGGALESAPVTDMALSSTSSRSDDS